MVIDEKQMEVIKDLCRTCDWDLVKVSGSYFINIDKKTTGQEQLVWISFPIKGQPTRVKLLMQTQLDYAFFKALVPLAEQAMFMQSYFPLGITGDNSEGMIDIYTFADGELSKDILRKIQNLIHFRKTLEKAKRFAKNEFVFVLKDDLENMHK